MPPRHPVRTAARMGFGVLLLGVTVAGWFGLAGRWDWAQGWIFVVAFSVFANGLGLWLRKADPGLFEERSRRSAPVAAWDRRVIRLHSGLSMVLLVVAALDAGRFHWSHVSIPVQLAGWGGLVVAAAVIIHVFRVNPFLSAHARIQDDRGQTVVSRGLYGVIRHPMYLAVMLRELALPLALGSLWALVPGALAVALFGYRTAREDRMLREQLTGYSAYAARVPRRLLPGIW